MEKNRGSHKVWTVIGVVLCVILLPILIINCTLLVKSFTDKDSVPSFGGYMPMIVLSGSMLPEIEAGDMIICKVIPPESVEVGDVISFYDPDGNGTSVVTHRVTEISEQGGKLSYRTKGDNNNTEDASSVPSDKLVARYTGKRIAGAGSAAMFMQTAQGLVVCVVIPLLLLTGYDLLRRRSYEKHQREDTEALRAELERLRAEKEENSERDKF